MIETAKNNFYSQKDNSDRSFISYYTFFRSYILPYLPKDKKAKILDLGCGSGKFLYSLDKSGYKNYFGIDNCDFQISKAKEKVNFVEKADMFEYLPKHKNEFDAIGFFDVAEHIDTAQLKDLLDKANKALKEKGVLIIHTLNGYSPFSKFYFYGDPTHVKIYGPKIVGEYAKDAGFDSYAYFAAVPERIEWSESFSLLGLARFLLKFIRTFLWNIFKIFYEFSGYVALGSYSGPYTPNFLIIIKK